MTNRIAPDLVCAGRETKAENEPIPGRPTADAVPPATVWEAARPDPPIDERRLSGQQQQHFTVPLEQRSARLRQHAGRARSNPCNQVVLIDAPCQDPGREKQPDESRQKMLPK